MSELNNVTENTPGQFEQIGGRPMLEKVAKIFYDKIYDHPWIGKFFLNIDQAVIEEQQVDFMSMALGGPRVYLGKLPIPAHKHMLISHELFDLRSKLLNEALTEAGASTELIQRWNKIDEAFRGKLVKENRNQCEKRYKTDTILDFKKPA